MSDTHPVNPQNGKCCDSQFEARRLSELLGGMSPVHEDYRATAEKYIAAVDACPSIRDVPVFSQLVAMLAFAGIESKKH